MSTSPSFEKIDYQLRYNKHIERKLVFDVLSNARPSIDFHNYCYLGFGSMWFSDFRLAHRTLGISNMISMERKKFEKRANFNRPLRCISVQGEDSTVFLGKKSWNVPHITWLDYDGSLDESAVLDLTTLLDKCTDGSVILISVNADRKNYRPSFGLDSSPRKRQDTALGQIESLLGAGVVPSRFELDATKVPHEDVSAAQFPEFLAESTLSFMIHRLKILKRKCQVTNAEGESILTFRSLFNFCHKDGVEMVTVGGVIFNEVSIANTWKDDIALGIKRNTDQLPTHQRLDLVPLTLKEKLTLDSCLPQAESEFLAEAKLKDIGLNDSELTKYRSFYSHFPVFFESPV